MGFVTYLKDDKCIKENISSVKASIETTEQIIEKEQTPEELLRGAGFKIKLITPTSFGTQIDFAKQYDHKDIEKVLKDFSIKIKGKSVFIVD